MKRFSVTQRIATALSALSLLPILIAGWVGVLPTGDEELMRRRASLCEQLANSCALQLASRDLSFLSAQLKSLEPAGARSLRIVRFDGLVVFESENHQTFWQPDPKRKGLNNCLSVPLIRNGQRWGHCEVAFEPIPWWKHGWSRYLLLVGMGLTLNGLSFLLFLVRVLRELDPNSAVPQRVRNTLDTIVGGVVVLDASGRVMLVNESFVRSTGIPAAKLIGTRLEALPWRQQENQVFPWDSAFSLRQRSTGQSLFLSDASGEERCFVCNATPIFDAHEKLAGALVSFEDITQLEDQRRDLVRALESLEQSREQIRRQNDALREMASRDPLTGTFNRRALFEQLESLWQKATVSHGSLAAIMMDVDHFKRLNDTFGHAAGDDVLRTLVKVVASAIAVPHCLGRYGGEEFCVLLPGVPSSQAVEIAEQVRAAVESQMAEPYHVTCSIGVGSTEFQPASCHELLELADKALYEAKHSGRNRVMLWSEKLVAVDNRKQRKSDSPGANLVAEVLPVSYQAVVALHAALSYKHADTALHSQRVAEFSVAVAKGLMSFREIYLLEIGALLHDIGKIGIPDGVLLKPGKLDSGEWRIMEAHADIGVEIIESAFHCKELTDVLRYHHCRYDGVNCKPGDPKGDDIPLSARIVGIADAYDAMVSDRVYRRGRPAVEAFEELRRCAGSQFDPHLVERFIAVHSETCNNELTRSEHTFHRNAIQVGQQLDRVLQAFESRDTAEALSQLEALRLVAEKGELPTILATVEAIRLELAQSSSPDWDLIMPILQDLVDCCLLIQRSFFQDIGNKPLQMRNFVDRDSEQERAQNHVSASVSGNSISVLPNSHPLRGYPPNVSDGASSF